MLSVSFRIWTRVAVSISYDDNHYTTGTSQISNHDGKSASLRKTSLGIFTSTKVFPPTLISAFQFSMASVVNFNDFLDILHFQRVYYPGLQGYIIGPFAVNLCEGYIFFALHCFPWRCSDQCTLSQRFLLIPCDIFSVVFFFSFFFSFFFFETVLCIQVNNRSPP